MTFDMGLPNMKRLIRTPYGLATFVRHHEDGTVDIYIGNGRTLTVPGSTEWK